MRWQESDQRVMMYDRSCHARERSLTFGGGGEGGWGKRKCKWSWGERENWKMGKHGRNGKFW